MLRPGCTADTELAVDCLMSGGKEGGTTVTRHLLLTKGVEPWLVVKLEQVVVDVTRLVLVLVLHDCVTDTAIACLVLVGTGVVDTEYERDAGGTIHGCTSVCIHFLWYFLRQILHCSGTDLPVKCPVQPSHFSILLNFST